jgi:hypothetical protein
MPVGPKILGGKVEVMLQSFYPPVNAVGGCGKWNGRIDKGELMGL